MSRQPRCTLTLLLVALLGFTGCHPTQPFYFHEDGDLSHYIDRLTQVEHPDLETATLPDAAQAPPPLNIDDPNFDQFWDLSLEQVINTALANSTIIRSVGAVTPFGVADGLLSRTAAAPTVYDPAISETNTLGGQRPVDRNSGSLFLTSPQTQATQQGVEDALSEFDAQFFSSFNYSTNDRPRNVQAGNPFNPLFFEQQSSSSLAALSKKTATGAIYSLRNRTSYTHNNIPLGIGRALPSDWQTEFEVEAQFPLMQGRGAQVNRIPVVLARINTDISLAEFEASVRNLVMDTENTYWDLYCAYQSLATARVGRDSAQLIWQGVNAKYLAGKEGGSTQQEAQSREQFHFFSAQLQTAQHELFEAEARLRWLMGLGPTDGRVIRPIDEPTMAEVHFQWDEVRFEALLRSPELRQQKWRIKQRELELTAARNQLLPRLNATVGYRWLGVGDNLLNADRNGLNFPVTGSTAFDELFENNFQEATVGLEFTPPQFGARRPLAAISNSQYQLARAKAQLEEMEVQQVHLLSTAWRNVKFRYNLAVSHFDRWAAAQREVESATALQTAGTVGGNRQATPLDLLLDAQRRRAQSQNDYYRAICDYNKALAEVHFRKGSLLEFNNIHLDEGPWPQKAYWDALEKARERDASYYLNYGWTRPRVVSRGPDADVSAEWTEMFDGQGDAGGAELIPTPAPTPATSPQQSPTPANRPLQAPRHDSAPPAPPKEPSGPITTRPEGPALQAPVRAENRPSSRRSPGDAPWDREVVPAAAEQPVGNSSNPLRRASYEAPSSLR
jgi:outer membrane protein TolC